LKFGKSEKRITFGGKYQWKPDSNPAVGQYDPNTCNKPRVKSAIIR
jgi:hypothetical protein